MRVTLNGYVSADEDLWLYDWYGYQAFSPSTVRQALQNCPDGEDLVFEINSYGGNVWAGAEMYSVLRSSNVKTKAEVQSLSASAASYMMLGCDEVWISPVAEIRVHLPATVTDGDRNEHRASIHLLDSITESILNAYELKSAGKKTRDELSHMMHNTDWLTAQEALDTGLVDGILYQGEVDPKLIVNAATCGMRGMAGALAMPDIATLREQYYNTHKPAGGPAADINNWQDGARRRIAIEQNRFGGM